MAMRWKAYRSAPEGSRSAGHRPADSAEDQGRPRRRTECPSGPCPWAGCRHHLAVDVSVSGRAVAVREGWIDEMTTFCSLHVADRVAARGYQLSQQAVGRLLGMHRDEVRELEQSALAKLRQSPELAEYWRARQALGRSLAVNTDGNRWTRSGGKDD